MLLLPDKYENLDLCKHEKLVVNILKSRLDDDVLCLLKINPTGMKNEDLTAIITRQGLFFIKYIGFNLILNFKLVLESVYYPIFCETKKIITGRFFEHPYLHYPKSLILKFPFNIIYFFPYLRREEVEKLDLSKDQKIFINSHCFFNESILALQKNSNEVITKVLSISLVEYKQENALVDKEIDLIIQRIAPEYTIPRLGGLIDDINRLTGMDNEDYILENNDKTINVFRLDLDQINLVNNLKKGHQLVLACAGSGKSVLLISKCFKAASLHPDRKFLITCYNTNLKSFYEWQINVAGFKERNVHCNTFLSFCMRLLDKYSIRYCRTDFDDVFEKANKALNGGIIKERFYGIFIDEIQIFKPNWYKFCYNLLENKETDDHFFIICGDKSQNINQNVKRGKAPWQGDPELPKYVGRSIRIEKNYRNSIAINNFITNFVDVSKKYFREFGIDIENEEDLFLRGRAFREGNLPRIFTIPSKTNESEAQAIINSINIMHKQNGIPYTEIAILMFNRTCKYIDDWNNKHYNIQSSLIKLLRHREIDFSILSRNQDGIRQYYGQREGVSLITFEGSLGLDYKGVIICGLKPMGIRTKSYQKKAFFIDDEGIDIRKDDFYKNINSFYTACTRAKDELHIILTSSDSACIYSEIIIRSMMACARNNQYKKGEVI